MAVLMISCRDKIAKLENRQFWSWRIGGRENNNAALPSGYCTIARPAAAESVAFSNVHNSKERRDNGCIESISPCRDSAAKAAVCYHKMEMQLAVSGQHT